MPKYSILIPVYNVEKYLNNCIDSVLNQTFHDFEIIAINDGSTDSSGLICDEYSSRDPRIRVFHQKNQGLLLTRRMSISKAQGEYLLFLDSDDFWDGDLLKSVNDIVEEFYCDMIIFRFRHVSERGDFLSYSPSLFKDKTVIGKESKRQLFEIIGDSRINSLCNKVVKRSIVDGDKDYAVYRGLKNGEDILQSLPMIYAAEKIIYLDKALYNYRMVPTSMTGAFNPDFFNDISIVRKEIIKYFKKMENESDLHNSLFYHTYLQSVSGFIHRLSCADMRKAEKISILKKIEKEPLLISALEKSSDFNCRIELKIRCLLFRMNWFNLLFSFERSISFLKKFRKTIKIKEHEK